MYMQLGLCSYRQLQAAQIPIIYIYIGEIIETLFTVTVCYLIVRRGQCISIEMAAVDNPPKSGVKLKIDSEISRGASCIVCEGKLNGKQVAVKRLYPLLLKYKAQSRELVQSAHLLKQLSHPHIVKIIEFHHSEDGDHLLVMERLDCNLMEYLKDHAGRLSRHRQIDFCLQIADAIKLLAWKDTDSRHSIPISL